MKKELFATDFIAMSFDEQESIINACLVNSAKLINSMQKESTNYADYKSYRDCVKFLFAEHDDIFNSAWIYCVENAQAEKFDNMPIALYVSKMSGKALRKAFYQSGKALLYEDITDEQIAKNKKKYENAFESVNCANCFDDYSIVFDMDRIENILSFVRDEYKAQCKVVIDMLVIGYNYSEIAKYMKVSVKTVSIYASAIANACAMVNCNDREWNALDRIIANDITFKDTISRKIIENAIIAEYKKAYPKESSLVINWQHALDRLKSASYYANTQKSLANAFYGK